MTVAVDDLRTDLEDAFARASAQFMAAQLRQQEKGASNHRTAVLNCRSRIDAVLDLYLDMRAAP